MTNLIIEDIRAELQCCLMEAYHLSPKLNGLVRRLKSIHAFLLMKLDTSKQEVAQLMQNIRKRLDSSEGELIKSLDRAFIEKRGYLRAFQEEIEAEINTLNTLRRDTEHLLKSVGETNQLDEISRGRTILNLFSMMLKNSSVDVELDDNVDCLEFSPLALPDKFPKIGVIITSYPKESIPAVALNADRVIEGADGNNNVETVGDKKENQWGHKGDNSLNIASSNAYEPESYTTLRQGANLKDCHIQTETCYFSDKSTSTESNHSKMKEGCSQTEVYEQRSCMFKNVSCQTEKQETKPKLKPTDPGCNMRYLRSALSSVGLVKSSESLSSESSECFKQVNKRKKNPPSKLSSKTGEIIKSVPVVDTWDTSDDEKFAKELQKIPDIEIEDISSNAIPTGNSQIFPSIIENVETTPEKKLSANTEFCFSKSQSLDFSFGVRPPTTLPFTFSPNLNSSPQPGSFKASPSQSQKSTSPAKPSSSRRRSRGRGNRRRKSGSKSSNESSKDIGWSSFSDKGDNSLTETLQLTPDHWWEDAKTDIFNNLVQSEGDEKGGNSVGENIQITPDHWWEIDLPQNKTKETEKSDKSVDSGVSKDITSNQGEISSEFQPESKKEDQKIHPDYELNLKQAIDCLTPVYKCYCDPAQNNLNNQTALEIDEVCEKELSSDVKLKATESEINVVDKDNFAKGSLNLGYNDNSGKSLDERLTTKSIQTENSKLDTIIKTVESEEVPFSKISIVKIPESLSEEGEEFIVTDLIETMENWEEDSTTVKNEIAVDEGGEKIIGTGLIENRENWGEDTASIVKNKTLPEDDTLKESTKKIENIEKKPSRRQLAHQKSAISDHIRTNYRERRETRWGAVFPPVPAKLLCKFGISSKLKGAGDYGLFFPIGVTSNSKGEIIVTDTGNNRVRVFDSCGNFLRPIGADLVPGLQRPSAVVVNEMDDIFVKDDMCIHMFTPSGRLVRRIGVKELKTPYGLGITHDGYLVTLDTRPNRGSPRVVIFTQDGKDSVWNIYDPLNGYPKGSKCRFLEVVGETLIVSDLGRSQVLVTDICGQVLYSFGWLGRNPGQILEPSGIAVDCDGHILLGDSKNNRVQIFTPGGEFLCGVKFSEGSVRPSDIHLTPDNRLIVSNYIEHQIKVYQLGMR